MDQLNIKSKSLCKKESFELINLISSANPQIIELSGCSNRSLMYTEKSNGDNIPPCGTPLVTSKNLEFMF